MSAFRGPAGRDQPAASRLPMCARLRDAGSHFCFVADYLVSIHFEELFLREIAPEDVQEHGAELAGGRA